MGMKCYGLLAWSHSLCCPELNIDPLDIISDTYEKHWFTKKRLLITVNNALFNVNVVVGYRPSADVRFVLNLTTPGSFFSSQVFMLVLPVTVTDNFTGLPCGQSLACRGRFFFSRVLSWLSPVHSRTDYARIRILSSLSRQDQAFVSFSSLHLHNQHDDYLLPLAWQPHGYNYPGLGLGGFALSVIALSVLIS